MIITYAMDFLTATCHAFALDAQPIQQSAQRVEGTNWGASLRDASCMSARDIPTAVIVLDGHVFVGREIVEMLNVAPQMYTHRTFGRAHIYAVDAQFVCDVIDNAARPNRSRVECAVAQRANEIIGFLMTLIA